MEAASLALPGVGISATAKSQTRGGGQAHLVYIHAAGEWLDGQDFHVRVPADSSAKLFWSVAAYDIRTRRLIDNEQQRGDRRSSNPDLAPRQ